jgi:hypothetical protein
MTTKIIDSNACHLPSSVVEEKPNWVNDPIVWIPRRGEGHLTLAEDWVHSCKEGVYPVVKTNLHKGTKVSFVSVGSSAVCSQLEVTFPE